MRKIKATAPCWFKLRVQEKSPAPEASVVSWIVRGLLIVSGTVTGWFVSKDAPNFSFIQGMASLVVIAVIVLVLAYWPARWTHLLDRRDRPD
jgi:hypothetical protein